MAPSTAAATEGGSSTRSLPMLHRFTLLKPGAKRQNGTISQSSSDPAAIAEAPATWNPLDLLWSSGLLVGKCDICFKRLGWKPVLECDDCGLRLVIPSKYLLTCFVNAFQGPMLSAAMSLHVTVDPAQLDNHCCPPHHHSPRSSKAPWLLLPLDDNEMSVFFSAPRSRRFLDDTTARHSSIGQCSLFTLC
jgi:hypothetical protein